MSWGDLGWTVATFMVAFLFIRSVVMIAAWIGNRSRDELG